MNVLIIDDNEDDYCIISSLLNKLGVNTQWVTTLQDAASIDWKFDVILLDMSLSDACSSQVTRYFAETARAPVIILSGNPTAFTEETDTQSDDPACCTAHSRPVEILNKSDVSRLLKRTLDHICKRRKNKSTAGTNE